LKSDPGAGDSRGGSKGFYGSAVSCAEAAEVFEFIEAAFDTVALLVEFAVVAAWLFPVPSGRDDGDRAQALDLGDDLGRVIPLVGDHRFGALPFEQPDSFGVLGGLSGGDAEGDRQPIFIGQQVDFGAQSTSGTPQSRVFGAPFLRPVAACW
jgi:hypothetical protein